VRHGDPQPVDESVFFGPDPELALVTADMGVWLDAHPCTCDEDGGLHEPDCPQA
jgi:hypothetical protein